MTDDDFAELFRKPGTSSNGSSWEDVAREFQALGETLGDAVRAAWQRTENDQRMRELHDSLNSMIEDVNRTMEQSTTTPEAQQAREQFARLTDSIRQAAEQATKELRPELISMLRQANAELRRLTNTDE
jgi:uncharacterized protein YdcH (DUF465 family)